MWTTIHRGVGKGPMPRLLHINEWMWSNMNNNCYVMRCQREHYVKHGGTDPLLYTWFDV